MAGWCSGSGSPAGDNSITSGSVACGWESNGLGAGSFAQDQWLGKIENTDIIAQVVVVGVNVDLGNWHIELSTRFGAVNVVQTGGDGLTRDVTIIATMGSSQDVVGINDGSTTVVAAVELEGDLVRDSAKGSLYTTNDPAGKDPPVEGGEGWNLNQFSKNLLQLKSTQLLGLLPNLGLLRRGQ